MLCVHIVYMDIQLTYNLAAVFNIANVSGRLKPALIGMLIG